jgi:hypothetical protein
MPSHSFKWVLERSRISSDGATDLGPTCSHPPVLLISSSDVSEALHGRTGDAGLCGHTLGPSGGYGDESGVVSGFGVTETNYTDLGLASVLFSLPARRSVHSVSTVDWHPLPPAIEAVDGRV